MKNRTVQLALIAIFSVFSIFLVDGADKKRGGGKSPAKKPTTEKGKGSKEKPKGPPRSVRGDKEGTEKGSDPKTTNRQTLRKPGRETGGKEKGDKGKGDKGKGDKGKGDKAKKPKHPPLAEVLGLDEATAKKFNAIRKAWREKIKSIRANKNLSDEEKYVQVRAAWKKRRAEVEALLTEDQWTKLQLVRHERRCERRAKHSPDHKNEHETHHVNNLMAKAIGLTADQLEQLGAARHFAARKRATILSSKSLSEEEKKIAIKEVNKQIHSRWKEVVTEEQRTKLRELRAQAKALAGENGGGKPSSGKPVSTEE